ncbi:hypothetical protein [Rhodococcus koreensis]|uniref:hypothetical protein n=1 Tax=Rhodococcus koreensis TaxID=99653 RepID=UPI00366AF4CC
MHTTRKLEQEQFEVAIDAIPAPRGEVTLEIHDRIHDGRDALTDACGWTETYRRLPVREAPRRVHGGDPPEFGDIDVQVVQS